MRKYIKMGLSFLLCCSVMLTAAADNPNKNIMQAKMADAALLKNLDQFNEYLDWPAGKAPEYGVKVVFTAKSNVTDFKFLEITLNDKGTDFVVGKTLYSLKTLNKGQPVVIGTEFPGSIPQRGISFIDASGKTHCFTLSLSGEDGSVVMSKLDM